MLVSIFCTTRDYCDRRRGASSNLSNSKFGKSGGYSFDKSGKSGGYSTSTERRQSVPFQFPPQRHSVVFFLFRFLTHPSPSSKYFEFVPPLHAYVGTTKARTPMTARRPRTPYHGPRAGSSESNRAIKDMQAMWVPSVPNNKAGGLANKNRSVGNVIVRASSGLRRGCAF